MSMFDEREEAFERKFAHDAELKFKATARRAKLLGLWAADVLGKTGEDREAYAKTVVLADLEETGEEDLFRKVRSDFDAASVVVTDHQIRHQMSDLLEEAVSQIQAG